MLAQLPPVANLFRGMTRVILEHSLTKPFLMTPAPPLPYERIWDALSTIMSYLGSLDNVYRESLGTFFSVFTRR
jgi:hypothetical protein